MADDYSGSIDWDTIYNTFHHPVGVAERIRAQLGSAKSALDSPIVFCGFPKVASLLSEHHQVLFVDSSPEMVRRTRERYPDIHRIVHSAIETFLETDTAKRSSFPGDSLLSGKAPKPSNGSRMPSMRIQDTGF
ncbi:MAG: hypothetical protein COB25_007920 [Oceanospirillales bacterium]|nr:hypothetical protein [Oceanospirillales bacterium]